MSIIKDLIRKLALALGYEITSSRNHKVRDENFQNLATAYEHLLRNKKEGGFPSGNALRTPLLGRLLGTPPSQAYEIIMALGNTEHIEGDVCEFGVAQGETSALIANEISNSSKILHLFDSFAGLPAPTDKDQLKDDIFSLGSMDAYMGEMSCPLDMVKSRLAMINFPESRYQTHQGFIEELVKTKRGFPEKVSFAFVDFDFYEPIKIALDYLDTTLSNGGIIMVDDYDFFSTGAKTATDEFIESMNSNRQRYRLEVADKRLGHFAMISKL